MKNIKLKIAGIKDNISKEKLLKKLKEKKGIKNVEFNIPKKILSITYQKINKNKIEGINKSNIKILYLQYSIIRR